MAAAEFSTQIDFENYAQIVAASKYLHNRKAGIEVSGREKRKVSTSDVSSLNILQHLVTLFGYNRDASSVIALTGRVVQQSTPENITITTTIFCENTSQTTKADQNNFEQIKLLNEDEVRKLLARPYYSGKDVPDVNKHAGQLGGIMQLLISKSSSNPTSDEEKRLLQAASLFLHTRAFSKIASNYGKLQSLHFSVSPFHFIAAWCSDPQRLSLPSIIVAEAAKVPVGTRRVLKQNFPSLFSTVENTACLVVIKNNWDDWLKLLSNCCGAMNNAFTVKSTPRGSRWREPIPTPRSQTDRDTFNRYRGVFRIDRKTLPDEETLMKAIHGLILLEDICIPFLEKVIQAWPALCNALEATENKSLDEYTLVQMHNANDERLNGPAGSGDVDAFIQESFVARFHRYASSCTSHTRATREIYDGCLKFPLVQTEFVMYKFTPAAVQVENIPGYQAAAQKIIGASYRAHLHADRMSQQGEIPTWGSQSVTWFWQKPVQLKPFGIRTPFHIEPRPNNNTTDSMNPTAVAKVHCEAALFSMLYCYVRRIDHPGIFTEAQEDVLNKAFGQDEIIIAVQKRCCFLCYRLLTKMRVHCPSVLVEDVEQQVPGTHGRIYAWRPPKLLCDVAPEVLDDLRWDMQQCVSLAHDKSRASSVTSTHGLSVDGGSACIEPDGIFKR